jgi:hypothetical protein
VADPVAKPANPPGATAGKSAPVAAQTPAVTPSAAKVAPQAASPQPITSIDDLIERAEDRLIAKGSTVRVSPDNADTSTKARQEELEDSLQACGIKLVWDKSIAKDAIVVEPPKKG